jgi:polyhydroxyalkanoate synthesis regulator phasin
VNESDRAPGGAIEQTEESAKRVFYAWVGAMATAYDAAEDTYEQFVRRGREATEEWQHRSEDARVQSSAATGRVRDSFRTMMDGFLSGLNMPTKAEVDAMNVKLNILMRKLDDLAMQQPPSAHPGQPEAPESSTSAADSDLAT